MTYRTVSLVAPLALVLASHAARAVLPIEICPTCEVFVLPQAHFSVTPTNLDFGDVPVGTTATIDVVVTNIAGSTLAPNLSGGAPIDQVNFGGSQNCAGKTFAPGDSCQFSYEFTPSRLGEITSSTTIGVDGDNFAITLAGVGVGAFSVGPRSLDFGHVAVGSTAKIDVVVTNITGSTLAPSFAGGAPFDQVNFGGSQNCAGKTFAPGASCEFSYEFTPSAIGVFTSHTTIGIGAESFAISFSGVGFDATALTFTHELAGVAKLKGDGFKTRAAYLLQLNLDVAGLAFVALDSDGTFLTGRLAPQGKRGKHFRLLLDDISSDSLALKVASQSAAASGLAAGALVGNSSTLKLKIRKDGSAALRMKNETFTSGARAIRFRAKLRGSAVEER